MKIIIAIIRFAIVLLMLCTTNLFAEPRTIYISVEATDKLLNNFEIEIKELITSPYEQNFCDIGLIEKFKFQKNKIHKATIDDTRLYYINISPYNLNSTFIPKQVDTLKVKLFIDEYPKLKIESIDSISIEYNKYLNWKYDNFMYLYEQEIYKLNLSNYTQVIDSIFQNSYFFKNFTNNKYMYFLDSNSFEIAYYELMLNYINKNMDSLSQSERNSLFEGVQNYIYEHSTYINQFNRNELISLSNQLINLKLKIIIQKDKSNLNKFLQKFALLRTFPEEIRADMFMNHIFYSHRIYSEITDTIIKYSNVFIEESTDKQNKILDCVSNVIKNTNNLGKLFEYNFVVDTSGNLMDTFIYKNKIVLAVFWTSWCPHCKEIIESTKSLKDSMKSNDFEIILISLDSSPNKWKEGMLKYPNFNHYISIGNNSNKLCLDLAISGVPTLMLINKEGKIIMDNIALPLDENKLIMEINNFLKTNN